MESDATINSVQNCSTSYTDNANVDIAVEQSPLIFQTEAVDSPDLSVTDINISTSDSLISDICLKLSDEEILELQTKKEVFIDLSLVQ